MKSDRKTEIKVGFTVIIGIIIFIWIIGWAKDFSFSSSYKIVKVHFENTSGLNVGDNVTVNGVKKGLVDDILLSGKGVLLSLAIEKEVKLYSDAIFKISMLDLMGGKKVEISSGKSGEELNYDKIFEGEFQNDLPTLIADLGKIQTNVSFTLTKLNKTLTSVNDLLTDDSFKSGLRKSVINMNKVSSQFSELLQENKNVLKDLISNANKLTLSADTILKDNRGSINESLKNLNLLSQRADTLFSLSNNFMNEIKSRKNNLGKFLYNETFYNNLDSTLSKLNELTRILIIQLKGDGINVDASIF